ncbi:tetratricopeptide repeat protein [Methylovirgula sp. 4M-Z18]|uniref:tetratricopeptide repeat protein n=1 Tax=Methylovirgula sp. 4M-Z18 TaxID=2293567 RepID=UPI001314FE9A|nr:tetratricopeptide repeat protein [Methylovirgula sp. 4M-Z18]
MPVLLALAAMPSAQADDGAVKPPAAVSDQVQSPGKAMMDELFQRLASTKDPEEAQGIATVIQRMWLKSGSDTADLLMQRAVAAGNAGADDLALTLMTRVTDLQPDWAEAWNQLANLQFKMGNEDDAVRDLAHVLALEPRHFEALVSLGGILQSEGDDKGALEAYRAVLKLYPSEPQVKKLVDKLAVEIDGRSL